MPTDVQWTLASASPRRLAILRQVGIEPRVLPADILEEYSGEDASELGLLNAMRKMDSIAPIVEEGIVLAADTMVLLEGRILGKPESEVEALDFLRRLRNRKHRVITAWVLSYAASGVQRSGVESTIVSMRNMSDSEIYAYIETGSPMDKAGAYGIQGAAAAFVDSIEGCYFNVVGLPISRVLTEASILLNPTSPVTAGGEDAIHG